MNKIKKTKQFHENQTAVVGIVTTILIIGLIVTVFAIIQTVYVPQWMEEIEMEHMNEVAGQFAELKYATDMQLFSQSKNQSITTPIMLGSDKIPFVLSERSYGVLEIIENACTIHIQGNTSESYVLGGLQYRSRNNQYVDQIFRYETGAVIVAQSQGSFLSSMPFFSVSNNSQINLTFTLVNVTSFGGKTSANGFSLVSISTQYIDSSSLTIIENVTQIRIETVYPNAWKTYFNEILQTAGLTAGNDYVIDYSIEDQWVTVELYPDSLTNQISINRKKLSAQISPGWIQ